MSKIQRLAISLMIMIPVKSLLQIIILMLNNLQSREINGESIMILLLFFKNSFNKSFKFWFLSR